MKTKFYWLALIVSASRTISGPQSGCRSMMSATHPATSGAEKDVPLTRE